MNGLSRNQWIGVGVALAIVIYFLLGNTIISMFKPNIQKNTTMDSNTNASMPSASSTDGGEASSPAATDGSYITVHYVGRLEDGTQFDSSRDRNQPFSFILGAGQVIKGWDTGLIGTRKGDRKTLVIPPADAYGSVPGHPLQNKTLIFDVEVLNVELPKE